jgi:hypothetical protein
VRRQAGAGKASRCATMGEVANWKQHKDYG